VAIEDLHWKDFELLVDLIFERSGWPRVSSLGGSQETIDLELEHPASGKRALAQVKSFSTQHTLDDYIGRAMRGGYDEIYFVCHTKGGTLRATDPRVIVWDRRRVAELVVRAGLDG
jgi:hypothetical protein